MDCYSAGNFAKSLAGHDRGCVYVIVREEGSSVYVADGRKWTVGKPKRKNKKHVQPIRRRADGELLRTDEAVRAAVHLPCHLSGRWSQNVD